MRLGPISRRRFLQWISLLAPVTGVAYSSVVEPTWVKIRRITPSDSKPTHRLVHFTDLHHRGDRAYLQSVIDQINQLSPDLVCLTGDLIEETAHLPECLDLLRQIKSPLYGVPGNHDYWADADFDLIAEAFAATGGAWLMDRQILTDDRKINVIGLTCTHPPALETVRGAKNVLLLHYPLWSERVANHSFDLLLAGHSHGGQVRLPFYGPILVPFGVGRFDMGLYQTPSGPLYVNPGIGYFYANIRFCCRPEITVFDI